MKLKLITLLLLIPVGCIAENSNVIDGVTIVSPATMDSGNAALLKQDQAESSQLKSQGYISTKYDNAKYLLNVKAIAPAEIKSNENSKNPYDTHLKQNISDIHLAFPYNGIHGITPKNIVGFAATGTVVNAGWTGVKEIFEDNILGICSLDIESRQLVKMQIRINADRVSYAVNSNPTTMQIEGDPKFGFRYSIFWTSNKYHYNLDCASKTYDSTILNKMVSFATLIDKQA